MDGNYTIIENVFDQNPPLTNRNQITEARGNIATYQVPEEIRRAKLNNQGGKVGSGMVLQRPDIIHLDQQPQMYIEEARHPAIPPINPRKGGINKNYHDGLACRDVFIHMENCPLCSQYYKKDVKFYWLIIIMLMVVLLFVTVKKNNK